MIETDAVSQTKDFSALAGHLERFLGKVHGCHGSSLAREIYRVGADAAANFQHALVLPAREFCEPWDMWLDKIFSLLDLVKILPASRSLRGMADIARPAVPIFLDVVDGYLFECLCAHVAPLFLYSSGFRNSRAPCLGRSPGTNGFLFSFCIPPSH